MITYSQKMQWLSRYKSKAGKAIARRSWEAAEAAIGEGIKEIYEDAAMTVEIYYGVGAHPQDPIEAQKEYANAIRRRGEQMLSLSSPSVAEKVGVK